MFSRLNKISQAWRRLSGRERLPFLMDALLKGAGQVFFCPHPFSGAILLAVLFLFSFTVGVAALLGLCCATATAWLLGRSPSSIRLGLYGFNGLIAGWYWGSFWPAYPHFWGVVAGSAAASSLLMIFFARWSGRYGLPALSFPSLIVLWAAVLLLYSLEELPFSPAARPVFSSAGEWPPALDDFRSTALGMFLICLAVLVYSRIASGMLLLGLGLGLSLAVFLGGPGGLYWLGLYAFTTAPLAMACGGIFFRWGWGAFLCGAFSAGLGALLWLLLSAFLAPLGLYPLIAPLNLVLWLFLWRPVASLLRRKWGLLPVPLSWVSRPEDTRIASPVLLPAGLNGSGLRSAGEILRSSSRIVVLAGAGLSTESGIPDYRSPGSAWLNFDSSDFVYDRFLKDETVRLKMWQASMAFYQNIRSAAPNAGHTALCELERRGRLLGIITQNVDGLHHKAGNSPEKILEIHGCENWVVCLDCRARYAREEPGPWAQPGTEAPLCPRCRGRLKPESILFGEPIPAERLKQALSWIGQSDLLLVIGSSLTVHPAASFPARAKEAGARLMILNLAPTPADPWADVCLRGAAGPIMVRMLREETGGNLAIRSLRAGDYLKILEGIDAWYGDKVSYLLHPLYAEHFSTTSFVAEIEGRMTGFLLGFISQDQPEVGYIHVVATDPACRFQGIGRALYQRFFTAAIQRGCLRAMAISVPYNQGSISFHRRLGFSLRQEGGVFENGLPVMKNYAGPGIDCLILERSLADPL